ncbi:MAG: hypothetical protein LBP53_06550 [Candidatus Peribacteria bacterium]|jgi:hypothetical protein|nr:hypothetical protein [Candidatus Peribacteria bacterium]
MKQIIKKLISLTIWLGIGISSLSVFAVNPPSYDQDFASHLTNDKSDIYVIKNDNIKTDKSLIENIKALFYPISSSETGDFIG